MYVSEWAGVLVFVGVASAHYHRHSHTTRSAPRESDNGLATCVVRVVVERAVIGSNKSG